MRLPFARYSVSLEACLFCFAVCVSPATTASPLPPWVYAYAGQTYDYEDVTGTPADTASMALERLGREKLDVRTSASSGGLFGLGPFRINDGEEVIDAFVGQLCAKLVLDRFVDHLMERICSTSAVTMDQLVDVDALEESLALSAKLASVREEALCQVITGSDPKQVFAEAAELRRIYDASDWLEFVATRSRRSQTLALLLFRTCPHYVRTTAKAAPWYLSQFRRKYLYQLLLSRVETASESEREKWISHYNDLYGQSKFLLTKGVHGPNLPIVREAIARISNEGGRAVALHGLDSLNRALREVGSEAELRLVVGPKIQTAESYGVTIESLRHGVFLPVGRIDEGREGTRSHIYTLTVEANPLLPAGDPRYHNLLRSPIKGTALRSLVEKYYALVAEEFSVHETIPKPTFDQVFQRTHSWRGGPLKRFGNVSLPEVQERAPERR